MLCLSILTLGITFVTEVKVNAATSNNWAWPTNIQSIQNDWPTYSSGKYHGGTDFPVSLNSPVYSTCDGEVVAVTSLTTSYGKHIKIRATVNGETVYMRYCHLNGFNVNVGDKVSAGQQIGISGSTGNSTGPHMHYEVRNANDYYGDASSPNLNPRNYLPGTSYTFETNGSNNFPGDEDTSWNVPVWKTANSKLNTYNDWGTQESNRWIDAGDNCYIEKVYTNGFVRVMYPTPSGDRWAYASASGFSLEKKQTSHNPLGYFDWVKSDNPGEIQLHGWAFDLDDVNASIEIHVYINDSHYATLIANKSRPDVNEAYSGVGNNHGFDDTLFINKSGNLNIKAFAINVGGGENVLVNEGEKTVSVSALTSHKCIKTYTLDGHTYKLYVFPSTWEDAKTWCESKDGYLATITTEREQKALYQALTETDLSRYKYLNFYLGGKLIDGNWNWVTGGDFSYTAWSDNQPDFAGNNEFYLGTRKKYRNESRRFWNDFTNNYSEMNGFIFESGALEEDKVSPSENPPTVNYSVCSNDKVWSDTYTNGAVVGTENAGRFRAVKIGLENCSGGIEYAAHFSDSGWSDYYSDGAICGSADVASSIEAIKIKLTGDVASNYNIFYRAYVRDKGWLGWTKNGEIAGSTGGCLPITALQIMLVPQVRYSAHVENYDWMNRVTDREICGTIGEGLRIEAIKIYLKDTSYGNIRYKTHLEDLGWGSSVYNGKASGTTAIKLRTEAFTVALDGQAAEMFDVMYKAHVQDIGWMDWVRNGTVAGTTGQLLRLEAFKVMVVPKGYTDSDSYKELTAENFTVNFDPLGGECSISSKAVSYCGFYKNLPTPTKTNYKFAGWYDSIDYANRITTSSTHEIKADITLYAKWIMPGDINSDNKVNMKDLVFLQQYLNNWDVTIDPSTANVNGDDKVNMKDLVLLQQYLNNWDVVLQ